MVKYWLNLLHIRLRYYFTRCILSPFYLEKHLTNFYILCKRFYFLFIFLARFFLKYTISIIHLFLYISCVYIYICIEFQLFELTNSTLKLFFFSAATSYYCEYYSNSLAKLPSLYKSLIHFLYYI